MIKSQKGIKKGPYEKDFFYFVINGTAPVTMKSSESVINYVSNTKGAIGIIQSELASEIGDDCRLMTISD